MQKEINYLFILVVSKGGQYMLKNLKKETILKIFQNDYIQK